MAGLEITITDAGRAEVVNAQNTGTDPVTISEIGVGTGQYTPDPTQTALQNEIKRLTTFAGDVVADDTIHVSIRDEGTDAYQVYEFGLYLASGTLLAVYSQTGSPILDKTASTILLLAVDIVLTTLDATAVTFGSTDFINPPATKTTAGVIELADEPEIKALTSPNRAITPEVLGLLAAAENQRGISRFGTTSEAQSGQSGTISASLKNVHQAFNYFGLGIASLIIDDLNNARQGFFLAPNTVLNRPTSAASNFFGITHIGDSARKVQVIFSSSSGLSWQRFYDGSAWSSWYENFGTGNSASQQEAENGLIDNKPMTPLRSHQAFKQYGLGDSVAIPSDTDFRTYVNQRLFPSFFNSGFGSNSELSGLPSNLRGMLLNMSSSAVIKAMLFISREDENLWANIADSSGNWRLWRKILHDANTGTAVNSNVTTSATDTTAGRLLKVGDVDAVGRVDYRTPLSGGGITLAANRQYHIVDSLNYSLPDTTGLTPGASVVVSKSIFAAPTILTFATEQISTDGGNFSSIQLSEDTEAVFIWNGTNWEMVAGDAAAGFTQDFSTSGYQKLPSGMIFQWGSVSGLSYTATGNQNFPISFPITFPTAALVGIAMPTIGNIEGGGSSYTTENITQTGLRLTYSATANISDLRFNWVAIGY